MREFELIIDDALRHGLHTERNIPFNVPFLTQALGFRCGRGGLEKFPTGDEPLDGSAVMYYVWPFPQYIVGEEYNLMIVRNSATASDYIYSVADNDLTTVLIATIDVATYGTGWLFEAADFGEYVFMTNGSVMVFWNVASASWDIILSNAYIPRMGTVCNHKGQAVGGNVRTAWYGCDSTFYIWSAIGSMNFIPTESNEAGYRRCPYGGEVYHVRRLGDNVVGYSSKGVTLLTPVDNPAPTYKFTELLNVGLCNRGAVNGSLDRHVFVGEDLIVREITKNGIKELGYYYWMEDLDGSEDIIVSYDPKNDDFFIGNSTRTFLLSPYGMTDIPQHPSAVWRRDTDHVKMIPAAVDAGFKPVVTSNVFNMSFNGRKTIFEVETDALLGLVPYASVDWANDLYSWGYGDYVPINDMGTAAIIMAGNYFMINIRFDYLADMFNIGYIKARYKMTDMRAIRGVYAPPPRDQVAD